MAKLKFTEFWQNGQMVSESPEGKTYGNLTIDAVTLALCPLGYFFEILDTVPDEVDASGVADICTRLLKDAERQIDEHLKEVERHTGNRLSLERYSYDNVDGLSGKVAGVEKRFYTDHHLKEVA